MPDQDIVAYAREAASRGEDLFALLATDATASESDIRRAFRRKALTAHPDKAGDAYDPALYERLERARDVLLDAAAREAYDNGMRAVLQRKMQLDQMDQKRRQMVEDLERREEEAKRARAGDTARPAYDPERAAMAARGRAKMEEWKRKLAEAEVREQLAKEKEVAAKGGGVASTDDKPPAASTDSKPTQARTPQDGRPTPSPPTGDDLDERIAELERRLKENQQRKAEKEQRRAEKKQRKAEKKGKGAGTPEAPESRWGEPSNNPPLPPAAAESQTDEDKVSKPADAAPSTIPVPAPAPTGGAPKASDKFASTMARLRAAQAKRNEEKKRREEEARASAGGGGSAEGPDASGMNDV
jgi:DnaJ family protein C protein 17